MYILWCGALQLRRLLEARGASILVRALRCHRRCRAVVEAIISALHIVVLRAPAELLRAIASHLVPSTIFSAAPAWRGALRLGGACTALLDALSAPDADEGSLAGAIGLYSSFGAADAAPSTAASKAKRTPPRKLSPARSAGRDPFGLPKDPWG